MISTVLQIISLQTPGLLYNIRGAAVGTSLDSTSEKESAWGYLCLTRMPQLFNYKTNKKHTNQWHHAEQNWLTNVAFWLRTSQWFSVVGSVVEHWLLKPGILGFRIPRSWWLFYIKKCLHSMPMAVFVFRDSRHFHARFCPLPQRVSGANTA